jgi:anti-sigma-K factor RskA
MTCEQFHDLLPMYALNALEANEAEAVRAHLATGCPTCAGRLAEYEAAAAQIPRALEPVAVSSMARQRLLERVAQSEKNAAKTIPFSATTSQGSSAVGAPWWQIAAALVVATLLGAIVTQQVMRSRERGMQAAANARIQNLQAQLQIKDLLAQDKTRQINSLESQLARKDTAYNQLASDAQFTEDMLKFPQWKIATIASKDPANPKAFGRLCLDTHKGIAHFYAINIQPPGPGKMYQLWLITKDGKKISAGTFNVKDAQGELVNPKVAMPQDAGPVMLAAVTDEPAPGVAQPTGTIRMAGALEEIH